MSEVLSFVIHKNELEGRFDPFYYQPEFKEVLEELKNSKWEVKPLGDIVHTINYGASVKAYPEGEVPFLRIQNLKENELDLTDLIFASKSELIRSDYVKEGDFLISRTGTIGIVALVPKECNRFAFGSFMIRFDLSEDVKINKEFLSCILNSEIGKLQSKRSISGAVQGNITIPAIKNIKIPIPPRSIQDKIAKIMQDAYKQKKERLQEAEGLLNLIDDYVLDKLRIKIPEVVEKKSFTINYGELKARYDPNFYSLAHSNLVEALERSKFELKNVSEITKLIVSGQRPKGGVRHISEGVPSLGGEHITAEGGFNFEKLRFIPREFHGKQKKSQVKPLDILIVKDGATTGKVAMVSPDFPHKECNINEHLFKIEIKEGVNPYFVFYYLLSDVGQKQVKKQVSGAAQKGITRDFIKRVSIPIPPPTIQNEIAEEVKRRRERAERLRKEAEEVVKRAKEKVERMIIG